MTEINYIAEIDSSLERISRSLSDSSEKVWHFRRSIDKKFLIIVGFVILLVMVNIVGTVINMNKLDHIDTQVDEICDNVQTFNYKDYTIQKLIQLE